MTVRVPEGFPAGTFVQGTVTTPGTVRLSVYAAVALTVLPGTWTVMAGGGPLAGAPQVLPSPQPPDRYTAADVIPL